MTVTQNARTGFLTVSHPPQNPKLLCSMYTRFSRVVSEVPELETTNQITKNDPTAQIRQQLIIILFPIAFGINVLSAVSSSRGVGSGGERGLLVASCSAFRTLSLLSLAAALYQKQKIFNNQMQILDKNSTYAAAPPLPPFISQSGKGGG